MRREAEQGFAAMDEFTTSIEGIRVCLRCYGFGFDLDLREKKRMSEEKKSVCVKRDKWRVKGGERGNRRQKRVIEEEKGNKDFWVLISLKKILFFLGFIYFFWFVSGFFWKNDEDDDGVDECAEEK